jgi:hypothetical protein
VKPKAPARPTNDPRQHARAPRSKSDASCLNDACRHQGLIDVSKYPDDTEVPSFAGKVVCAKCGARGRHIDVRPNWKEQPARPTVLRHD